jgi:hypothetical protein
MVKLFTKLHCSAGTSFIDATVIVNTSTQCICIALRSSNAYFMD